MLKSVIVKDDKGNDVIWAWDYVNNKQYIKSETKKEKRNEYNSNALQRHNKRQFKPLQAKIQLQTV